MLQMNMNFPSIIEVTLKNESKTLLNINQIVSVQEIEEADYVYVYMSDSSKLAVKSDYNTFKQKLNLYIN
ncbi:hypothetical protein [Moraxella sp. ZY210820]|uniref:hypothetical protein n=1 Tax=unclassified Moraxella TaxID=2685852 RepID=UPI00273153E2|nr:hypothetical protein [Moraxella sp. ZY210820]WLF82971.1 hypothetical protein LU301_06680 [Moraxella sp. ZY210820]